ncbi:MAG: type II secretion system protein GspD [Phycisphaerales bacterium JB040]
MGRIRLAGMVFGAGLACAAGAQPSVVIPESGSWEPVEVEQRPSRRVTSVSLAGGLASNRGAVIEVPGGALERAGAQPAPDEEMVTIPAFVEPVEITALIEFVQQALEINVTAVGDPAGQISINAPITVPKSRLLRLLNSMLYRFDYAITFDDDAQFYVVQEIQGTPFSPEGELATAKIIRTPNIKPSLISDKVSSALGQEAGTASVQPIDELGVLMVTGSAKTVSLAESIVDELARAGAELSLHRIELTYIAASTARQRAIGLAGGGNAGQAGNFAQQQLANRGQDPNQAAQFGFAGGTLDNLSDRLTVDATGNALLFRGVTAELDKVLRLINLIDVPNTLEAEEYFAGSSAQQIADIAKIRGLGEVIVLEPGQTNFDRQFQTQQFNQLQNQFGQSGASGASSGGPVMVVDIDRGSIIYYGTSAQQEELAKILEDIDSEDERVVIRAYKLKHGKAEEVSDLLDAIITGQQRTGESPLLPETRTAGINNRAGQASPAQFQTGAGAGDEVSGEFDPDIVTVTPDIPNNQVFVKAPIRQQKELGRLIEQLDLRRKQVLVEALIIAVSDTTDFRLSVESQILNGQYGIQTNFGLSTVPAGGGFQDQRNVLPTLSGLTAALIQSESIPFIINALQTDTDARVLSRPTLLVNDNEEGSIDSVIEQPTTSTTVTDGTSQTNFNGYEEAGTNLLITPTISKEGYLTLEYEITRASFTGTGTDNVPPPRATDTVTSKVTVPSNATIVVGGIKSSNLTDTIQKIPLLGDIPGLGILFQDRGKVRTDSVLYIFITPKIMTDPAFRDLRLATEGPQAEMDVSVDGLPELEPVLIRPAGARPRALESLRGPAREENPATGLEPETVPVDPGEAAPSDPEATDPGGADADPDEGDDAGGRAGDPS